MKTSPLVRFAWLPFLMAASTSAPAAPTVPPRIFDEGEFRSAQERQHARAAWARAVEDVWETRQIINQFDRGQRSRWPYFWDPGGDGWRPVTWFGTFEEPRFEDVHHVVNRIWEKLAGTTSVSWKMRRYDCVFDAAAHVVVVGQIRLCDDFFGVPSVAEGARILIHELSHHISVSHPPRVLTDGHVAPIPPCTGPYKRCYHEQDARMLARDHPLHAVANPDNYALFIVEFARAAKDARSAGRALYPGPPRLETEADRVARPVGTPPTEPNTDRPGLDYRSFDLPTPRSALCRDACVRDGRCRAWTYVKPDIQGGPARCWLKERVPAPVANPCCESGVIPEGLPRPPPR